MVWAARAMSWWRYFRPCSLFQPATATIVGPYGLTLLCVMGAEPRAIGRPQAGSSLLRDQPRPTSRCIGATGMTHGAETARARRDRAHLAARRSTASLSLSRYLKAGAHGQDIGFGDSFS